MTYCSQCAEKLKVKAKYNLPVIALNIECGHSEAIDCEGCDIKAVYKDTAGAYYLGMLDDTDIVFMPVGIEEL